MTEYVKRSDGMSLSNLSSLVFPYTFLLGLLRFFFVLSFLLSRLSCSYSAFLSIPVVIVVVIGRWFLVFRRWLLIVRR